MGKLIDLTGQRFNRLKVLNFDGKTEYGNIKWFCRCDCGNFTIADSSNLRNGNMKSCGCLRKQKLKQMAKTYKNEHHPQWTGDNIENRGAHCWISKNKVKPSLCERCNERPVKELSYKHSKGWSRNPEDYEYLCTSCHKLKDKNKEAKQLTKIRNQEISRL